MSTRDKVFIIIVGVGLLAFLHSIYLYFWAYGDIIHAQLTPKQWVSMYGINWALIALAAICLEIARSK